MRLAHILIRSKQKCTWIPPNVATCADSCSLYLLLKAHTSIEHFCGGRFPIAPSTHLLREEAVLNQLQKGKLKKLKWQQYTAFCSQHEAETLIVPQGLEQGFPDDIDFVAIDKRLGTAWIHATWRFVIQFPNQSAKFITIVKDMRSVGLKKWRDPDKQMSPQILNQTTPG